MSFFIVARNQANTIVNCLDSVLEAARASRLTTFEIIYVDSSSSDGTVEKVRAWQGAPVRIVHLTVSTCLPVLTHKP